MVAAGYGLVVLEILPASVPAGLGPVAGKIALPA
eukprot:SAG31_NODE_23741_length_497_cov_0.912060_1_plen_33_part_01